MDRLTQAIPQGSRVGIDTVIFIYQIQGTAAYQGVVQPFFAALAAGQYEASTSVVTLMEVSVQPLRLQRPEVAAEYETLLLNYPHLTVLDVDRRIARRAAALRAAYRFRPADSLQLATAIEWDADLFLTNDQDLARQADLPVLLVDTLLGRQ